MRIAFVVHKFPPDSLGGVETHTWSLAHALAEAGHEVHVFYPLAGLCDANPPLRRDGLFLWRVPLPDARALEAAHPAALRGRFAAPRQFWHTFRDSAIEAAFAAFLERVRPDVVHFQHVQGVSARLISLAAAWPRVITLHDYWFFCANSQLLTADGQVCVGPEGCYHCVDCLTERTDLRRLRAVRPLLALPLLYRNRYLRKVTQTVPLFLAPSEFLRQQYVTQGFPAARIQKVELGLEFGRLGDAAEGASEPHTTGKLPPLRSGDASRVRFGYVGALARHKGVHVLIEAFNRLPPEATLVVHGNEAAFPGYAAELRASAQHPGIRFAGPLDHRDVGAAMRQVDCLVVPSVWYENSPQVIQEAFGVGIPVVASRLGALPEKVVDHKSGRLFNPGDSADLAQVLRELTEHPDQLAAMRASIRPAPSMTEHGRYMLRVYQAVMDCHLGETVGTIS